MQSSTQVRPNTNLIVLNYQGGYGGDFLANLLQKAIDPSYKLIKHDYAFNKYKIEKYGRLNQIKYFGHLIDRHRSEQQNKTNKFFLVPPCPVWYWTDKIYKMCYDPDVQVFADNLIIALKEQLKYPEEVVVTNYHNTNAEDMKYFDINDVFPKCKTIFLHAENIRHQYMFDLLGTYKTRYTYSQRLSKVSEFKNAVMIGVSPKPPANSFAIDVGRLFFDLDVENMNAALSSYLGCNIVLDKDILTNYRHNNLKIITDIIGDVDKYSEIGLKTHIEGHYINALQR